MIINCFLFNRTGRTATVNESAHEASDLGSLNLQSHQAKITLQIGIRQSLDMSEAGNNTGSHGTRKDKNEAGREFDCDFPIHQQRALLAFRQ